MAVKEKEERVSATVERRCELLTIPADTSGSKIPA